MKTTRTTWLMATLLMGATIATADAQTQTATTPAVAAPAADSASLKTYVGAYTLPSGSPIQTYTISAEKGELYGEADSYGKNKLLKQAKADTYQSTSSYGAIITFVRDAATKAVTGLSLAAQGTEMSAKKDKP